jgi:hypothetical protein
LGVGQSQLMLSLTNYEKKNFPLGLNKIYEKPYMIDGRFFSDFSIYYIKGKLMKNYQISPVNKELLYPNISYQNKIGTETFQKDVFVQEIIYNKKLQDSPHCASFYRDFIQNFLTN